MSKLTLSVDSLVVSRAKRYAKGRGVSVSKIVETYLATVTTPDFQEADDTPILRSLRGCIKSADIREYRKHQAAKHR